MEFEHVFKDVRAEFMENVDLGRGVEPNAYDRLCDFFDRSVVPLLSAGRISWEHHGRPRKFVLSCAAGLGRMANESAATHGRDRVTREDVEAAARYLVDYWESICALPPARISKGEEAGRRSCPVRELLKGKSPLGQG